MVKLCYSGHFEDEGNIGPVSNGETLGTTGKSKRLEAIKVWLENKDGKDLNVFCRGHAQNIGWMDPVYNGDLCGTTGEGKRLEAIQLQLTGADRDDYWLQYQVHSQNIGWTNWAKNGELCGSVGGGYRIEAIRIALTPSGVDLNIDTTNKFIKFEPKPVIPEPESRPKKTGHVYLATGHGIMTNGKWDPGCVDGKYTEAGLMLPIVKIAVSHLRNWGIKVTSDADHNNNKNMTATVAEANRVGADVYISLHCDYNQAPSGTLPIIYPGSQSGIRLANCLIGSVKLRMGLGTRGILQRDDYEVSATNMPACIFETGSIRADINKLLDFNKYAEAIAQGIYDYF